MKRTVLILTFLWGVAGISIGQDDQDYGTMLKKMFEVSGSEESYRTVITQMISIFREAYSDVGGEIWDELEADFLKTSIDELVEMLVPVYQKYLTQKDLEEIVSFYETPVGKKFAKNTPFIMQESMQVGQQWGMKIGQEFEKKMTEKGY